MSASDIVIIGGGVIGASIAFHLARRGARPTLLERGTICSGETARSGGFVQTHWDTLAEVKLIAWSRALYSDFAARVGGSCGFVRGGYLHVTGAEREADVRRVHAMVLAEGLESHWLAPSELVQLVPMLNADKLVGGAWEPTSGWCDPIATTRALADAARRAGADIREGVTVTAIEHAGDRITGVATTAGAIATGTVILAAGAYAPALHLGAALPITLERGQCGHTSRPRPTPYPGFYDELSGLYTHPLDNDSILIGRDRDIPFLPVTDPEDYKRDVDAKWVARAGLALGYRFPALREAVLRRGITGLYDFTPDGQPIVDGPVGGIAGYYVAAGFSGVGFKSAPAIGLGVAELVLDGKSVTVGIDHLRLARFVTH